MPDKLAEILENYLVIDDPSLRELRAEVLKLCQRPEDTLQAVEKLEETYKRFASRVDYFTKVPASSIFLSYAWFKQDEYIQAMRWAGAAVDGYDQLGQRWNSSIACWVSALTNYAADQPDESERNFFRAFELMEQVIGDHRRGSRYDVAEECQTVRDRMLEDARLLQTMLLVHTPMQKPNESEQSLFADLLKLVYSDAETAERLVDFERDEAPKASRSDLIRSAIDRMKEKKPG
jgi:hypothetical protein